MRQQRWISNNCVGSKKEKCSVVESYDENNIFIEAEVEHKCSAHSDIPDEKLRDVLVDECHRVADVTRELMKDTDLYEVKLTEENEEQKVLKSGCGVDFSFVGVGEKRQLECAVTGYPDKASLNDRIQTKFGESLTMK